MRRRRGRARRAAGREQPRQTHRWIVPSHCTRVDGVLVDDAPLYDGARVVLGGPDLQAIAMELALGAAARSPSTSLVEDAAICHGATGVAHQFHRLYLATGENRLAAAARFWLDRVVDVAGDGGDAGLVCGDAGIALALVTAIGACAPAWDRALLPSVK
jgi:hypothetical protein